MTPFSITIAGYRVSGTIERDDRLDQLIERVQNIERSVDQLLAARQAEIDALAAKARAIGDRLAAATEETTNG